PHRGGGGLSAVHSQPRRRQRLETPPLLLLRWLRWREQWGVVMVDLWRGVTAVLAAAGGGVNGGCRLLMGTKEKGVVW
nr:hypothetical protein [Tanacetum cinerariifolium]